MPKKDQARILCILLFIVLVGILMTDPHSIKTVRAFSDGPQPGRTGAPGELTCAVAGCHIAEVNSGPGQFVIEAPSVYEPGKIYQITVRHMTADTSRKRWGFELTALDGTNNRAGDLQSLNGLTQTIDGGPGGTRVYIEHSFLGTFPGQPAQASWTFNWVAPSTDAGAVTFYAAGNQANNDGNNTGDQIYTSKTVAVSGPPEIVDASVKGKQLIVSGKNFGDGALLFMDGSRVKKVFNDEDNPTVSIIAKKAGRDIAPGQTVSLQVVNPDKTASNMFSFRRPD